MQLRPIKPAHLLATAVALAVAAACSDGGPSAANEPPAERAPAPQMTPGDGSEPIAEMVFLCKEGPEGVYEFNISSDRVFAVGGNIVLDHDGDDGLEDGLATVQLEAGSCVRIALAGGALDPDRATVTVEEVPGAGSEFVESTVVQLAAGITVSTTEATNPVISTVRGDEGAIITFLNRELVGCTLTQGYWKNHPDAWPVNNLDLGLVNYDATQLMSILNQPVKGNGLVSLAHQLIAAKLNVASGASGTSAIGDADALIGGLVVPPVGGGYLAPSATSDLVGDLSDYNEGLTGPGHCDD